ncbi:discoidin domain-containing protein [Marinomonas agarivorans]|nr:discoidin domain-containing protein [Marinomonas agarivorans]
MQPLFGHKRFFLLLVILIHASVVHGSGSGSEHLQPIVIQGKSAKVGASSELQSKTQRYSVLNAFDNDATTAWVEGVAGNGIGETITVQFDQPQTLHGITLKAGYTKSTKLLMANATPHKIKLTLDDDTFTSHLLFDQEFSLAREQCELTASPINTYPQSMFFSEPKPRTKVTLEIVSVVEGAKYKDLAISDIEFHFQPNPTLDLEQLALTQTSDTILGKSQAGQTIYTQDRGWIAEKTEVDKEVARLKAEFGNWDKADLGKEVARLHEELGNDPKNYSDLNPEYWLLGLHSFPLPEMEQLPIYIKANFMDVFVSRMEEQDSSRWVSALANHIGASEWAEVYKTLQINTTKQIESIQHRYTFDGAPGCWFYVNDDVFR